MRPQLASQPNTAVFTNGEPTTVFAILRASSSEMAPSTSTSISFVAPSPSRAIDFAKSSATMRKVCRSCSSLGVLVLIGYSR